VLTQGPGQLTKMEQLLIKFRIGLAQRVELLRFLRRQVSADRRCEQFGARIVTRFCETFGVCGIAPAWPGLGVVVMITHTSPSISSITRRRARNP